MGYLGKEPRKDGGSLTLGATLDTNGNEIGSFSSYMYALNVSYARQIDESSSWGVNGKYFYQELAVINSLDASSGSFALDVGYFKHNALDNTDLKLGAVLTNVGPGVSFNDGEEDPLPTRLGMGMSLLTLEGQALVAFDLNYEVNDQTFVTNFDKITCYWNEGLRVETRIEPTHTQ